MRTLNIDDQLNVVYAKDQFTGLKKYLLLKRVFDLAVCVLLLPFVLIIMGMIALIIKLDSPGPAIFVQKRIGRGGKAYRMYKFRSMRSDYDDRADREFMSAYVAGVPAQRQDAPSNGPSFKPDHRANVTRVGKFLRKTSLDEIPQIFNVLKGEMSRSAHDPICPGKCRPTTGGTPNVWTFCPVSPVWHRCEAEAV